MRWLRRPTLAVLIVLWCTLAAAADERVERTVDRMERVYQQVGPRLGCLLYEPQAVLTVAGLVPEFGRYGEYDESDRRAAEKTRALLGDDGLRLRVEGDRLELSSLEGLETLTTRSELSWMTTFQAESGWEGWGDWFSQTRSRLEGGTDDALAVLRMVQMGRPDAAVRAAEAFSEDRDRRSRTVQVLPRFGDRLGGEGLVKFQVLAKDVRDPRLEAVVEQWERLLVGFYTHPRIVSRLSSEPFLQARTARVPSIYDSPSEKWDRGLDLASSSLLDSVPEDWETTYDQEFLLAKHADGLISLVNEGAYPHQWRHYLEQQSVRQDRPTIVPGRCFDRWVWFGALGESPHREQLYKAVKARHPDYVRALAAERVDRWKKNQDDADEYVLVQTYGLFGHPEVREYFRSLSRAEQASLLEILDGYSGSVHIRTLLQERPYRQEQE